MAELRFACPSCRQDIVCDELWSGHQTQCPSCHQEITVPAKAAEAAGNPLVPKVPEGTKLSFGHDKTRQPAVANRSIPIRNLTGPPPKKKNPWVQAAVVVVVLAGLGVGGYFAYPWVQQKLQAMKGSPADSKQAQADSSNAAPAAPAPAPPPPPAPVVWTLDLDSANIPDGPANGMIAGAKFTMESARVDHSPGAEVLRLIQGSFQAPDREVLIYLILKPGQGLGGLSLSVPKDAKGIASGVGQVIKRWKAPSGTAPQLTPFASGYALKLELSPSVNGAIPGKIYLALPDPEQTVVAGTFQATVGTGVAAGPPAPATQQAAAKPKSKKPKVQ